MVNMQRSTIMPFWRNDEDSERAPRRIFGDRCRIECHFFEGVELMLMQFLDRNVRINNMNGRST